MNMRVFLIVIVCLLSMLGAFAQTKAPSDLVAAELKARAALQNRLFPLPGNLAAWEKQRGTLTADIQQHGNIYINHQLPLHIKETGRRQLKGYSVRYIWFQTRPGVYATANLYVPDGKGPFPAVINMHGHWPDGKAGEMVQSCAHTLALHGYVCLNIDAWGSGERTTEHGVAEYHGANLGAALLNIGETLLGSQVADNIRGVDLLCSLPYVDTTKIGATGASGGGNQTMWLSAMDTRIKAAMPVVSVGTFESYIMNSNCVCELLPGGFTFTEEAGVLGLVAPRALKICSALKDASATFKPAEMLRSYENVRSIYDLYHTPNAVAYQLFDTTHGYWPEMRSALLGWMDQQLKGKGNGAPVTEMPFTLLPAQQLQVFPDGRRNPLVMGIAAYCKQQGNKLKPAVTDTAEKRRTLKTVLGLIDGPGMKEAHTYAPQQQWERVTLETTEGQLIPLSILPAAGSQKYVLLLSSKGKDSIPAALLQQYQGANIILADLWGIGECASTSADKTDGRLPHFHTLARSAMWLGNSVMAQWVGQLQVITNYIKTARNPVAFSIDAEKELGLAALFYNAISSGADTITLRQCPVSYVFDEREGIDFFNMAIHVPGIISWGNVALAAALSGKETVFIQPVTMSGRTAAGNYQQVFKEQQRLYHTSAKTVFVQ
ncbi:S9 family peptidase [Chitinophaga sp. GbtcB8]|uniref:alpha/beta hydrolase family protein n=1 Tax=Chitinophaga sp. GbtcB8 TaxID=2824753 RepID=UPI001C30A162|nr:acetylxylan esterase [Chitinophaga sp. GbtcB8]